jgi:acetyltransferase-like isoleucine patch superfamily enzyme
MITVSSLLTLSSRDMCTFSFTVSLGLTLLYATRIEIARETLIGSGAVIMNDTVEKGVYVLHRVIDKTSDEIEL